MAALSHSNSKCRPDIDGLRAIAVLSVVAFHAFPNWLKGGFIGVDVFFVISGFLISTILFENLERGTFSFAEFYARRIRRIFPALLLVLIASYTFGWFALLADEYKQLGKHIAAGAGFVSNLVLWSEAGYFDNASETKPLRHLWSLGIEEQFYIIWPLLLWFAWKRKFNFLTVTMIVAIASFYLNVKGTPRDAIGAFYAPQTRFWELLCGSVLAWTTLYRDGSFATVGSFARVKSKLDGWLGPAADQAPHAFDGQPLGNVLSFVGLLLLALGCYWIDEDVSFPGYWAVVPVVGAVLIIAAGPKTWINRTVLSHRVAVWFGLISYPLYLWHWPLLSFAQMVENEVPSSRIRVAAIAVAIILAWLTYELVEKPIRSGKHSKAKTVSLLLLMGVVGYLGFSTYSRDGFGFRHQSNVAIDEQAIQGERAKYWAGNVAKNFDGASLKVLVYGDSQAFDVFKALRNDDRLGIKLVQASYECTSFSLPKGAAPADAEVAKDCDDAFVALLASPELKKTDVLIYSIYWEQNAEPPGALENYQSALTKIKAVNPTIRVIFFGPKPLLGKTWGSINSITKQQKSIFGMDDYLSKIKWIRNVDAEYVRFLSQQLGVGYVDVNEVFCLNGCQFYVDQQFTHFDQNHWTEFGAKLFLDKLIHSQKFNEIMLR